MALLAPLALLLGLLAVPIIILYMLKLRRREVEEILKHGGHFLGEGNVFEEMRELGALR